MLQKACTIRVLNLAGSKRATNALQQVSSGNPKDPPAWRPETAHRQLSSIAQLDSVPRIAIGNDLPGCNWYVYAWMHASHIQAQNRILVMPLSHTAVCSPSAISSRSQARQESEPNTSSFYDLTSSRAQYPGTTTRPFCRDFDHAGRPQRHSRHVRIVRPRTWIDAVLASVSNSTPPWICGGDATSTP